LSHELTCLGPARTATFAALTPSDRLTFLLRLKLLWLPILAGVAAAQPASAPAGSPATTALPPALAAFLAARPTWSGSIALQAGVGYKDNLVLSPVSPEHSGFARYGFEAFAWRLPRGGTDFSAILSAEETRFFEGEAVKREANAFAQIQARYRIEETFRFAFDVQGYHLDEIRDVSDTDVQRLVAKLNMVGAAVGPTVRWSPRPWWWLEVQALGKRDSHRDGSYNAKVGDGEVRLGWRPSPRVELSASHGDFAVATIIASSFPSGEIPSRARCWSLPNARWKAVST
jgi:hypothetical protein